MDKKEINKILGREISDAEFHSIDFSGVIEDLEQVLMTCQRLVRWRL